MENPVSPITHTPLGGTHTPSSVAQGGLLSQSRNKTLVTLFLSHQGGALIREQAALGESGCVFEIKSLKR